MRAKILGLLAVGLLSTSMSAQAALVSKDYAATGDGLITLDTTSGLEWLDFTETRNLTIAAFLAGTGGWSSTFRLASRGEVAELLLNAGLPDFQGYTPGIESATAAFNGLFNTAGNACYSFPASGYFACARWVSPTGQLDLLNVGFEPSLGGYSAIFSNYNDLASDPNWIPGYGIALVRQSAVPEPGTLALLGLGLAGLGLSRRRKAN